MELGATVCVPNGAPLCEQCPWNSLCLARKEGRIAELPVRTKAKARRIEKRTVLVIRDNDKVAIRKRPEKGLLAGLYELPNVEGRYSQDEIVHLVKEMHLSPIRVQEARECKTYIFPYRMAGWKDMRFWWKKQDLTLRQRKWQKINSHFCGRRKISGKLCDSICVCRLRKIYGDQTWK